MAPQYPEQQIPILGARSKVRRKVPRVNIGYRRHKGRAQKPRHSPHLLPRCHSAIVAAMYRPA